MAQLPLFTRKRTVRGKVFDRLSECTITRQEIVSQLHREGAILFPGDRGYAVLDEERLALAKKNTPPKKKSSPSPSTPTADADTTTTT